MKNQKKKNTTSFNTNQNKQKRIEKNFSKCLKIFLLVCLLTYNFNTAYASYDIEKIIEIILNENSTLKNIHQLIQIQEKRNIEIKFNANAGSIAKDSIETHDPTKMYHYAKAGLNISLPLFSILDKQKIIEKKIQHSKEKEKITDEIYQKLTLLQNYNIEILSKKSEIEFLFEKIQWTKKRVDIGIAETELLWKLVENHIESTQKLEILKNKKNFLIRKIAHMGEKKWEEILSLLGEKKTSKKF